MGEGKCGYDLRASRDLCPECGRGLDPADPRTYRKRPPSAVWWWVRWVVAPMLVLPMTWGGVVGGSTHRTCYVYTNGRPTLSGWNAPKACKFFAAQILQIAFAFVQE
jgi:hypothetical protein